MDFTPYDTENARLYSNSFLLEYQLQKYKNSHPHIFNYVEKKVRPATNSDFYIPFKIKDQCKIVDLSFTEIGCLKIACYSRKSYSKNCTKDDSTIVLQHGNQFTFACQPACFHLFTDGSTITLPTEFKNNKCKKTNYFVLNYALWPEHRSRNIPYLPFHAGLDIENNILKLNEVYCNAYGLNYNNDDCYAPLGQEIVEVFIGSTIYRSIKLLDKSYLSKLPPLIKIPHEIASVTNWKQNRTKRSIKISNEEKFLNLNITSVSNWEIQQDQNTKSIDDFSNLGPIDIKLIAESLLIETGITMTLSKVATQTKKLISETTRPLFAKFSKTAVISTLVLLTKNKIMSQTLKVMAFVGKSINIAYFAFNIAVLVLDLVDPFKLNSCLSKDDLYSISLKLIQQYKESTNYENDEITPEIIWNMLEGDIDEKYIKISLEKTEEYLRSLDVNSYGQRLKIQRSLHNNRMKNILLEKEHGFKTHLIITSIVFILGIFYTKYIFILSIVYLIFVFFYNRLVLNKLLILM